MEKRRLGRTEHRDLVTFGAYSSLRRQRCRTRPFSYCSTILRKPHRHCTFVRTSRWSAGSLMLSSGEMFLG